MQVAIGLMTDHLVEVEMMKCLLNLLATEQQTIHGRVITEQGSIGRLDRGRNSVIRAFGAMTGADWLLFIDSDIVFTPADFRALTKVANGNISPIVSGLYFKDTDTPQPVMFEWDSNGRSKHVAPTQKVQRVDAVGMGFLLVHRGVFDTIYTEGLTGTFGQVAPEEPWCDNGQLGPGGQPLADDMSFCWRATQCGFPIKVVTTARLGHIKSKVIYGRVD